MVCESESNSVVPAVMEVWDIAPLFVMTFDAQLDPCKIIVIFLLNKSGVFDTGRHIEGSSGSFFGVPCSMRIPCSSIFAVIPAAVLR